MSNGRWIALTQLGTSSVAGWKSWKVAKCGRERSVSPMVPDVTELLGEILGAHSPSHSRGGFILKLRVVLSVLFLMIFLFAVNAANARDEGFSGKWVLDRGSQRPGDGPNNLEQRIKQDNSGVTIESTFKEPDNGVVPLLYLGVMTTKLHLSTNGETQQNQIGPFQMGSKTTINGNQMETEWTAMAKNDQVQGHWTHTLSSDGRHMTLAIKENSTQGQQGEATLHFVRK
jgi:hypothetical protein